MKVLVINCGSSSLKYQLLNMENESLICKGTYERIGEKSFLTHKINGEKIVLEHPVKNHKEALDFSLKQILDKDHPAIKSLDEIDAIGHRIVHGADSFSDAAVIDDYVIGKIDEYKTFAPLHNPAAIMGIKACQKLMPNIPMVAVFDTAFHYTIPKERYMLPIPYKYYEKYNIRKYGCHGTSHKYVANRIAELLNKSVKDLKIVNCHLGQGASICAIMNGESVETSMGLTPLGGIPMCSRSGDLDPSVITYLMEQEKLKPSELEDILNKESGLFGLTKGLSADCRDIEDAIDKGNEEAKTAMDLYEYKVAQFIAAYAVSMQGIDVITFTAGIGENQSRIRAGIIKYLNYMGIKIDDEKNSTRGEDICISSKDSTIPVWVVPTNEELMIAKDTLRLLNK